MFKKRTHLITVFGCFLLLVAAGVLLSVNTGRIVLAEQSVTAGETSKEREADGIRQKPAGSIAEIQERGVLIAGLPAEDLLAFYEEDAEGNMTGTDVELARAIAESLGVDIVFYREAVNNDDLTRQLENGEIDMIAATYSRTLERSRKVRLSEPYLSIGMAVMINKQAAVQRGVTRNPTEYLKHANEKIAVVAGTSHVAMCRKLFPDCEPVEVGSYDEAEQLVKNNQVFAYFCGELEFYSEICRDRELQIYTDVYVYSDIKDEFCVAVAKENQELQDYINLYLEMSRKITIDDIHDRYDQYYGSGEVQRNE